MARVKDNVLVKGFSGTIGGQLTFRQMGGDTFVSKYQKVPSVPATEKKLEAQTRFGMATAYARGVIKDPAVKAMYQEFATGRQRAFNIAVVDALHAPVVENIQSDLYTGCVGDPIVIRATDDFKVASVVVSIYNRSGELIEQGDAVLGEIEGMDWLYKTSGENPEPVGSEISAVATDLPGNSGSLKIMVS